MNSGSLAQYNKHLTTGQMLSACFSFYRVYLCPIE
jgi:hypothetical protein